MFNINTLKTTIQQLKDKVLVVVNKNKLAWKLLIVIKHPNTMHMCGHKFLASTLAFWLKMWPGTNRMLIRSFLVDKNSLHLSKIVIRKIHLFYLAYRRMLHALIHIMVVKFMMEIYRLHLSNIVFWFKAYFQLKFG